MADEWPLRDFIEVGGLPGAVPCLRLHARHVLREWGLGGLGESAEQVVSELVTNAVAASESAELVVPVRMWLLSDKSRVLILVWDACPRMPVRAEPADDAESGRGLFLVEAFSSRWGAYPTPGVGGKAVWAVCET